jgi:hypothetical protein
VSRRSHKPFIPSRGYLARTACCIPLANTIRMDTGILSALGLACELPPAAIKRVKRERQLTERGVGLSQISQLVQTTSAGSGVYQDPTGFG